MNWIGGIGFIIREVGTAIAPVNENYYISWEKLVLGALNKLPCVK